MDKKEIEEHINSLLIASREIPNGSKHGLVMGYVKSLRKVFDIPKTAEEIRYERVEHRIQIRKNRIRKLHEELKEIRKAYKIPPYSKITEGLIDEQKGSGSGYADPKLIKGYDKKNKKAKGIA